MPKNTIGSFYNPASKLLRLGANMHRTLPQHCALCAAPAGVAHVCAACDRAMPRLGLACPSCALPTTGGETCGRCLRHPPAFVATRVAFVYAFPLDRLVQQMKYGGSLACVDYFADALAASISRWPDALLAVPLAPARQRARGCNQALEIAARVARHGGARVDHSLIRIRDTPAQAALPWAQRLRNVRGAFFAPARSLDGMHVAIVDDVMTTGATLAAAAAAARCAGAASVEAWAVARTLAEAQTP